MARSMDRAASLSFAFLQFIRLLSLFRYRIFFGERRLTPDLLQGLINLYLF